MDLAREIDCLHNMPNEFVKPMQKLKKKCIQTAQDMFYTSNNQNRSQYLLDLHGLQCTRAKKVIDKRLELLTDKLQNDCRRTTTSKLKIIHGKGDALGPLVREYFDNIHTKDEFSLTYEPDTGDPGCCWVIIQKTPGPGCGSGLASYFPLLFIRCRTPTACMPSMYVLQPLPGLTCATRDMEAREKIQIVTRGSHVVPHRTTDLAQWCLRAQC